VTPPSPIPPGIRPGSARRAIRTGLLLASTALVAPADPVAAAVIRVDADADGPVEDGTSWCTAYRTLSAALEIATSGDEIRIAGGTYRPDPAGAGDPRTATFALVDDVLLEGGYAGCGTPDPDLRDLELHATVLSGDAGTPGSPDDDAYHVLTIGSGTSSELDGVTIASGNADVAPHDLGGGVLATGGTLALSRCILRDNRAVRGGAIYAEGATITLARCVLRDNEATGEGGVLFLATGSCRAESCLLTGNHAGSDGGALFSDLSLVDLVNVTAVDNHSDARGGGIYNYVGVEMTVTSSIFWANGDLAGTGEAAQLWNQPSNFLEVNHSCVMGWTGTIGGSMSFGDDPDFVDAGSGDLHLQGASPCIDAGDDSMVTLPLDLDGRPRRVGTVDLGCYEYSSILEVPGPGAPAPGLSVRPHPVRGTTRITVPRDVDRVVVIDAGGRRVASLEVGPDPTVIWDGAGPGGSRVAAGVYLLVGLDGATVVTSRPTVVVP